MMVTLSTATTTAIMVRNVWTLRLVVVVVVCCGWRLLMLLVMGDVDELAVLVDVVGCYA